MYDIPTPEQFKEFLKAHNLTGAKAAAYSGVDARTARRWTAPVEQKGARSIPWAAWALIQIFSGEVNPAELKTEIEKGLEAEIESD
ncbi:hypothetical protein FACS189447_07820 [Spirochaetia bacterium]|nr:hypothetical protein FACS189447_07820 [Spirochaetia bacterium]